MQENFHQPFTVFYNFLCELVNNLLNAIFFSADRMLLVAIKLGKAMSFDNPMQTVWMWCTVCLLATPVYKLLLVKNSAIKNRKPKAVPF